MVAWSVLGRARLGGEDRSNVDRVRRACEAAEPLDLKVELDEADHLGRPIHFLASAGDDVIGYAGLTAGDEAEVCGMVHPSWRGRGVGHALLAHLQTAGSDLGRASMLVICEDAGPVAIDWMRRLGASRESAERRMVVRLMATGTPSTADAPLEVRPASDADHDRVVELLGEEFSDRPEERRLVGLDGAGIVGTLRLIESSQRTMIYGFVIDEGRRNTRLGTRMLAAVFERLRADGVDEVGLEVDPDNIPAVRLYERFGFETVTTYRYMRLPTTRWERPE
ncbi:MAG: GNAT family N-acetyltransferase [Candidatus Dormibacteria bacterium]